MLIPMKIKRNLAHYDGKFIKIKANCFFTPSGKFFLNVFINAPHFFLKDYIITNNNLSTNFYRFYRYFQIFSCHP